MSAACKWSIITAGLIVTAFFCFGTARFLLRDKPPQFKVAPLPSQPRHLSTADVDQILRGQFTIIRKVSQVPDSVKQDYMIIVSQRFEMVNPGQEMSTDAIISGVPNKKLIFAAVDDTHDVLVFEVGAFASSYVAIVASHEGAGGIWAARLDNYSVHDIAGLVSTIEKKQFTAWPTRVQGLSRPQL